MKQHFYSHIIEIDTVEEELKTLNLEGHEHEELVTIVHSTIHHTVVDTVLSELSEEDKKQFLKHLSENKHESLWKHLKQNIEHVEEKIKSATKVVLGHLKKDIEEVKNDQAK